MTIDSNQEQHLLSKPILKYLISYHELVTKDENARKEWLQKELALFPDNKDLAKIAAPETDVANQ